LKKNGILNKDLSEVIASMGHKDMLVIGDAGLPIPKHVRRIDLAVIPGIPSFVDVIKAIENDLRVEKIIIAKETEETSPVIFQAIQRIFSNVEIESCTHEEFKQMSNNAVAVVRTGEFTPYANIILVSGVIF